MTGFGRAGSPAQALMAATTGLSQGRPTMDLLSFLVRDCAVALGAQAVGLIVVTPDGHFETLVTSSHVALELDAYEVQQSEGPCIDAGRDAAPVTCSGDDRLRERWPRVGPVIIAAGFHAVRAYPVRWHGYAVGAVNIFLTEDPTPDPDAARAGQAFADLAAVILATPEDVDAGDITTRIGAALASRATVEQAKGVTSYLRDVPPSDAYEILVQESIRTGRPILTVAHDVIAAAHRPG